MSVATNQYLILGVKLPYKGESHYEDFEDYIDNGYKSEILHKNGLACVYDGMDGKYIMLGRIIEKSPVDERIDGPFCFYPVDPEKADLTAGLINLSFPKIVVSAQDIKLWFLTHYH